ncbi:hypothetical protein MAUB1S_09693 [Mycolicibacterium aubagnense]
MSDAIKEFVEEARGVSIEEAAKRIDLKFKPRGYEHPQPCPQSGGVDRFSFNTKSNVWVCRGCGTGGHDAIGMVAHCEDLDLKKQDGLLEVCSLVLGKEIPAGGAQESDEDRLARQERKAARQRAAEADKEKREKQVFDFREAERTKSRGIVSAAQPLQSMVGSPVHRYLADRGCGTYQGRWLRYSPNQTYWHGQDERGDPISLHTGPAMVVPYVDATMAVIGCHITWIDLNQKPKFRPLIVDNETGEILPTKKMRGSKKGGLLPLLGGPSALRWVAGEGIENTLAFAKYDGLRADTFYCAAGDLGNLSGPAEASSRFPHPELKKRDKNGVERSVMIAGSVPKSDQSPDDAMWVANQVEELVLLGDGDSERVMTAAAMVRARARHARPGRLIPVVWAPPGMDFNILFGNDNSDRD